jgi:RNA polymerase sigma factor (sigma-70 family)
VVVDVPDQELLVGCLGGQSGAWNALIERYTPLIYSVALKDGLSEPDAADIFQAVCVTLFEKLGTIRDAACLPAWLITTTTRERWAVRRRAAARRLRPASAIPAVLGDSLAEEADPDPLPEESLLAGERQAQVRGALNQLPPTCRMMLSWLFDDSLRPISYQELGELLGMSSNSVGPTRARCLERLRSALEESGYMGGEE